MSSRQFVIALAVMAFMAASGGFAAVAVFLDMTPAQADSSEVVQTPTLEIVDGSGKVRARLGVDEKDTVSLTMLDGSGMRRVELSAAAGSGALALHDAAGTRRALLAQTESDDRVKLLYMDRSGEDRWLSALTKEGNCLLAFVGKGSAKYATLVAGPEQATALLLQDPKTKRTVTAFAGKGQSTVQLSDAQGQSSFQASAIQDGRSVFALSKAGKLRVRCMTGMDGKPELVFMDEARNKVWTAGQ